MNELLDDELSEEDSYYKERKQQVLNLLMIQVFMALIATILAGFYEIASIMITGPIGSIWGFVVLGAAERIKYTKGMWIGGSAPAFSIGCFLTVFALDWGRGDAHIPITTALAIYTIVLILVVFLRKF